MPIYAYRCSSCGLEKDMLRKLSDAPLTQCPQCGKDTFSKQVTAAGFQLKGSGWYVTDFRGGNNGNGNGAKPGSSGSDKSADSAASGGDTSAAPKSNDSASNSANSSSANSSSGSTSAASSDSAAKPASSTGAA
jgi:putative FmdB family regulatory protein